MMAVLDGEATDQDRGELETLLEHRPELRPDWDRLRHAILGSRLRGASGCASSRPATTCL
jgi:anti-sigma factor RsiW